jgi:predicted acetyltransferase
MRESRAIPLKSKPTFAVVVDGDCEVWYLQMLKRHERSIRVNIEPKIPQRKKLSDQFQLVKKLSDVNTKVFWIIDFDVIARETRHAKVGSRTATQIFVDYKKSLAKNYKNVVVIVNNPCLEFWLLLHFEHTSKSFETCADAEKQLKKHLADYEKSQRYFTKQDTDIYFRLRPKLAFALENAKLLKQFDHSNPTMALSEMPLFFQETAFGKLFE